MNLSVRTKSIFTTREFLINASLKYIFDAACMRERASRFDAFLKWPVNYRRSFIPPEDVRSRATSRSSPPLAEHRVPRIIISRSLVAPFIGRPRTPLWGPGVGGKTGSFSSTAAGRARHAVLPVRAYRERVRPLLSWCPNLLARAHCHRPWTRPHRTRAGHAPLWTPTAFTITKPPTHFLIPAPVVLSRSLRARTIIATSILHCALQFRTSR